MAYGLEVKNNYGQFLLTTDYKHYAFLGRYSVWAFYPNGNVWDGMADYMFLSNIWCCDIPAVNRPIVLLDLPQNSRGTSRLQDGLGILSVSQLNATTWRVYIVATAGYVPAAGCVLAFVHASDLGVAASHGLQMFKADGSLAYDSSRKALMMAENQAGYDVQMRHFFCTSVGATAQGIQTIFPSFVSGRIGSYFTGSAARVANAMSTSHNRSYVWAEAQAFPVFSYYQNSVFCNWSPVLMNTGYFPHGSEYDPKGTFLLDGTYWWTKRHGPRGSPYSQKVILVDPNFY